MTTFQFFVITAYIVMQVLSYVIILIDKETQDIAVPALKKHWKMTVLMYFVWVFVILKWPTFGILIVLAALYANYSMYMDIRNRNTLSA